MGQILFNLKLGQSSKLKVAFKIRREYLVSYEGGHEDVDLTITNIRKTSRVILLE